MNKVRILLLLSIASGCHHTADPPPVTVSGFKLNAEDWNENRTKIEHQAAFDLQCPNVSLTVLQVGNGFLQGGYYDDWATRVGVRGCDRQATYVRTLSGWVQNTVVASQPVQPSSGADAAAPH
jgi:hypothetical protein